MSPKEPFANAVAKQGALWRLMTVLERPDPIETNEAEPTGSDDREIIRRKVKGWALLESLSSSPSIATKIIESSCWVELLGILVGYAKFSRMWAARVGAAKTLSRLMWDPQTGPSAGKPAEYHQCCYSCAQNDFLILFFFCSSAAPAFLAFYTGCAAEGRGT